MILAAQFRALAAVDAGLLDQGPHLVDIARDRVFLAAEFRHPPGVDHVVRSGENADFLVDREYQRLVDIEQIVRYLEGIDARTQLPCLVAVAVEATEKGNALVHVFIIPHPLITRDFNGDIRIARIFHFDQGLGGGDRHDYQYNEGNDGPNDFHDMTLMESGGLNAAGLAVEEDRHEHDAEYDDADDYANPENDHMQSVHFLADGADAAGQIDGPIGQCRFRQDI